MKRLFMGSLLICLLLVSTACEAIETGDLEDAAEFVAKLEEIVDLLTRGNSGCSSPQHLARRPAMLGNKERSADPQVYAHAIPV